MIKAFMPTGTQRKRWMVFAAVVTTHALGTAVADDQRAAIPVAAVTNREGATTSARGFSSERPLRPEWPRTDPGSNSQPFTMISPGVYELGLVRLDKAQRSVRFPATVNLLEGNIEYLVVHATGKTHESLFRTEARPEDIHLALLLLGARGAGTNTLPTDATQLLPGDLVEIEVHWKTGGWPRHRRGEECVQDLKAKAALRNGPWAYNGSRLREDGFAAQIDGSIIALITDPDALVNNPRPRRDNDDNWKPRAAGLPALNSTVEVSIRLLR